MNTRITRWLMPGMGLGWAASLLALGWVLPSNLTFVDDRLAGALLLLVLPALVGAVVGVLIAALFRWAWRGSITVDVLWLGRIRWLSFATGIVVLAACLVSNLLPPSRVHTRLMVYGVDGATWTVIDALRPLDMLPAFEELESSGASGTLLSIEPMLSPLVWTTIASGQPLDGHGIAGFHVKNTDCKAARFWDVLESKERVVGTYKWLVTYPPRETTGFQVPGWLATGPEMVPRDLEFTRVFEQSRRAEYRGKATDSSVGTLQYVSQGVRHGLQLSTLVNSVRFSLASRTVKWDDAERLRRTHELRAEIDIDLFFGLLERFDPDVATFTYYPTDSVAHRTWRYFEPDKFGGVDEKTARMWDAIPSTYRQADEILAQIRDRLPPDAHILVLSDHGMCAAGGEGGVAVYGLRAGQVDRALKESGAAADVSQVGMKVTVAVAPDGPVSEEDVRALVRRFSVGGQPLFKVETVSNGVFGLTLALQGDLEARTSEPVTLPDGGTTPLETFLRMRADYSGVHHEEGVIFVAGPNIKRGVRIEDADLYDVAPTLLAMMEVPQSDEMIGRVLTEVFEQPPELKDGPESYDDLVSRSVFIEAEDGASRAGDEALDERLRALGYVDGPAPTPPPTPSSGGEQDDTPSATPQEE